MRSPRNRVEDLVSHRFDLADAPQAFALAKKPVPGSMKVLVTVDGAVR